MKFTTLVGVFFSTFEIDLACGMFVIDQNFSCDEGTVRILNSNSKVSNS